MLVLARTVHQRIWVGHDVMIEVSECQGGKVKLAFGAPREIEIVREELLLPGDDRVGKYPRKD